MAKHEIVKRAFLNKTPAREDFFVFSVSNVIDVLPGEVIEAKVVQKLINSWVFQMCGLCFKVVKKLV